MAYTNVYPNRINWENEPSINTPINETNLNKMDYALYQHDRTLENWDTTKANQSDLLLSVKTIDYDTETGVFVFTWQNGTTKTVDLNIEKIPVNFSMSPQGVITMTTDDGTTYTADVGALIKTYTFNDSSEIDFTVLIDASGNKTIQANIVDGSINGNKLQPNYLADCTAAKTAAENAEDNAEDSAEDAEAWAVGERNGVPVDPSDPTYHNNSKYWSQQANPTTLAGLTDTDINDPEDGQVLTFNGVSEKWENADPAAGGGSKVEVSTSEVSLIGTTATLTDGTITLSAEFDAGGKATFTGVTMTGDLTLTATDGVDTITRTISIPYFGNYSVVVAFFSATVNVTFPFSSGATCILSDGVTTLNATASPMAFNVPNAGTWTATVTLDGVSKQNSATITTDGQTESITIEYGTINLSFDDDFRGQTVTCINGGTTITKVAPSSGNTMIFYPPTTGTWDISSTIGGTPYYTSAEVTSLSTPVPATLNVRPDGKTVTPTDDISIWLACAGINKNYTTLAEVLADSTTLLTLLSDNNACDYLVRSKSWATANGNVPIMTSNTTPSGEVVCDTTMATGTSASDYYLLFDGAPSLGKVGLAPATTGYQYFGYDFGEKVTVKKVGIWNSQTSGALANMSIIASDDGITWNEILSIGSYSNTATCAEQTFAINGNTAYKMWAVKCQKGTSPSNALGGIQFYLLNEAAGLCDNSTAMTDIGANDYCAETLLSDLIWCNAICNSAHFESVLTIKVPTMTGATTPSGEASAISNYSNYFPWKAFNPNEPTGWVPDGTGQYNVGDWLRYDFVNSVAVSKAVVSYINTGTNNLYFKIQGSKTGNVDDWHDICGEQSIIGVNGQTVSTIIAIPNIEKYRYYRTYETTASLNTSGSGMKVQFYGR